MNKVIILLILFSLLCCEISNSQENNDAYIFADKIIELTLEPAADTLYELRNEIIRYKPGLEKYYNFRTNNRPFYTVVVDMDSISDTIITDSLTLKMDMQRWTKKYNILDSLFSLADIEHIINTEINAEKWDSTHPIFNSKKLSIKWCSQHCKNAITKPYYNKEKNHAFIINLNKKTYPTYYIFRKEYEDWVLVGKIDSFGS